MEIKPEMFGKKQIISTIATFASFLLWTGWKIMDWPMKWLGPLCFGAASLCALYLIQSLWIIPKSCKLRSHPRIWVVLGIMALILFGFWSYKTTFRVINYNEVRNTTRLQEAIIIDLYRNKEKPSIPRFNQGEMTAYYEELFKAISANPENTFKLLDELDLNKEIKDLLDRKLIYTQKVTEVYVKPAPGHRWAKLVSNTFLTPSGEELAKDLLYLRSHTDKTIPRPITGWSTNKIR